MSLSSTPDSPYWAKQTQGWAVDQHRQHHNEVLYLMGEHAIFVRLWTIEDFNEGLVDRCGLCYHSHGGIADTYGQSSDADCLECFGTTFSGGIKQQVIRPSIWDFTEKEDKDDKRGQISRQTATVQSTEDFKMKVGDFIIRGDNSRYQVQALQATHLRTGFGTPGQSNSYIGNILGRATLEDDSSVAYKIPPTLDADVLTQTSVHSIEHAPPS